MLVALLGTWLLLRLRERPAPGPALAVGIVVGLAIVVNEAFLIVPPLIVALFVVWSHPPRRLAVLVGAFALGVGVALAPGIVRNLLVGAPALKLAVTGSTVYAVFNAAGSSPYFFEVRPAAFVPIIEASGGDLVATVLGCLRSFTSADAVVAFYLHKAAGLVVPFENPDNANFYYAAVHSPLLGLLPGYALLFPVGVVGMVLAARRLRDCLVLAPFALSLLVSILISLPLSRYRTTLVVFLVPFAGLALARAVALARSRRLGALAALVAGALVLFVAAGAVQDRAVFAGAPRAFHHYRPAEFLLGAGVYERQGRLAEAAAEARTLSHAPTRAVALLVLGRLEALRGDRPAAAGTLAASRRLDPANPWLLHDLGDVYSGVLGDRPAAADCYRAALGLPIPERLRRALDERLRNLEVAPVVK